MDDKQKRIIFWMGTVLLACTIIFLLVKTDQISNSSASTNTVVFTGEGKVVAKPDIAVVNVSIVTEALTSIKARNDNTAKSTAVIDFIKKQNLDEKDVKTTGYNIYPQYTYPPYGKATINGYQVNQTLEIKIRDLDKVGVILDGVVSAGANQVNNLTFQIDNPDALKAQARKMAVDSAKEKAMQLEKEVGIHLGRIVNFSENYNNGIVPMYNDMMYKSAGMGGGGSSTEVPSGENEIVINVSITYQIK